MLIYRVETENGLGPWCDSDGLWGNGAGTGWCSNARTIHTAAHKFMCDRDKSKWRFGFFTMSQLFHYAVEHSLKDEVYFHTEIEKSLSRMKALHLGISVYDVHRTEVLGDETQCIFYLPEAEKLKHFDPTSDVILRFVADHGKFTKELF